MAFYNEKEQLYWETDALDVSLRASLVWGMEYSSQRWNTWQHGSLWLITFASKSLAIVETWYSNIKRETLGILHSPEKSHHYCFPHEVSIVTDHKPLVAVFKKYVASLSHRLQRIILCIDQYNVKILYKPGPQVLAADWLSRYSHEIGKDEEISRISISINVIETYTDIPECITAEEIWLET